MHEAAEFLVSVGGKRGGRALLSKEHERAHCLRAEYWPSLASA